MQVIIHRQRGWRIMFVGSASANLSDAATAFRTALEDAYNLTPTGAAVVRTSGKGITVGAVLFETGFAVLRQRGSQIVLTLEMDGLPDLGALETLVVTTFGLTNHTMIADTVAV